MILSMTGYGKATGDLPGKRVMVEVKTINSRQNDLNIKLPQVLREKESEIRNMLSQKLERGRIDLIVTYEIHNIQSLPVINKDAVKIYYQQVKALSEELGIKVSKNILTALLRFPDAMQVEKEELAEEDWTNVRYLIEEAVGKAIQYRIEEGKALEKDIVNSLTRILSALEEIRRFEPGRTEKIREKLTQLLETTIQADKIDRNRLEQEIIYYLEKFDINEEKVRLKQHCDYFLEKLNEKSSNGKMLGFISQEIGREINTIGSKANDADIQKIVVGMKDDLEKIKEQLLNVL